MSDEQRPAMTESKVDAVDVLDVRRHLFVKQSTKNANAAFLDWRDWCNYLPEADKARAAVAELIEAATEHSEFFAHYSSVNESCQDDMAEERNRVLDRLRAALAALAPILMDQGYSASRIAKETGITYQHVRQIVQQESATHHQEPNDGDDA